MIATLLRGFEIRSTFSINLFCCLFIFSAFIWSLIVGSRRESVTSGKVRVSWLSSDYGINGVNFGSHTDCGVVGGYGFVRWEERDSVFACARFSTARKLWPIYWTYKNKAQRHGGFRGLSAAANGGDELNVRWLQLWLSLSGDSNSTRVSHLFFFLNSLFLNSLSLYFSNFWFFLILCRWRNQSWMGFYRERLRLWICAYALAG